MLKFALSKTLSAAFCLVLIFGTEASQAQFYSGQPPPPTRKRSELERILGPADSAKSLSRELHICFVWGYDNLNHNPNKKLHPPGCHEFRKFKDLGIKLLSSVPKVVADSAYYFPSKAQWAWADVVVWHLPPDYFVDSNYAYIDAFQARGGGMIVLGEATIMYPTGNNWSKRIGMAWNEGASKFGPLPVPQKVNQAIRHPLLEGFPDTTDLEDELYWKLMAGDTTGITVLLSSQAGVTGSSPPVPADQMPATQWPVAWTYEKGPGKVFATCVMHNFWTFNDPLFRILFFRAIAWETGESLTPFLPLITQGLTVTEDATSLVPRLSKGGSAMPKWGLMHNGRPHRINGVRLPGSGPANQVP